MNMKTKTKYVDLRRKCDIDTDGSMNSGCDTYDEYVHGLQWQSPNFPVDEVKD
jgi:hypothetical protein